MKNMRAHKDAHYFLSYVIPKLNGQPQDKVLILCQEGVDATIVIYDSTDALNTHAVSRLV